MKRYSVKRDQGFVLDESDTGDYIKYEDFKSEIDKMIRWCKSRRNSPDWTTLGMVEERLLQALDTETPVESKKTVEKEPNKFYWWECPACGQIHQTPARQRLDDDLYCEDCDISFKVNDFERVGKSKGISYKNRHE